MKRLLSLCLLGITVAAGGTACTTKGGTPPDPVPAGPPSRWAGTASYSYELRSDTATVTSSDTQTFDVVNITWVKDANASPAPPAGGARYVVASGAVHVTWRGAVDIDRVDR